MSGAVFLSYASQDAEAARCVCEALRIAGIEVWFDAEGGLEHGDEWDAKIRHQIKECVLFIPLISANTQARHEGYFRIEWELAAERAMGIAHGVPFILPIAIDDTREPEALVPDRFRKVQWMRLPGGVVSPEVQAKFLKLWSHRSGVLSHQAAQTADGVQRLPVTGSAESSGKTRLKPYALIAASLALIVAGAAWWALRERKPAAAPPGAAASAAMPMSEARQLATKGHELVDKADATRDDYALAEDFFKKAIALDATDGEIWAGYSQLCQAYVYRGFDVSNARREQVRVTTERAQILAPEAPESRYALVGYYRQQRINQPEQERILRELHAAAPTDKRILKFLAVVLVNGGKFDEGVALLDESARLPGGDALALYNKSRYLFTRGRWQEASSAVDASLAQERISSALVLKIDIDLWYRGDLEAARSTLDSIPPDALLEDRAAYVAATVFFWRREPEKALEILRAVPRDYFNDFHFRGPKAWLTGKAFSLAGRADAAAAEWRAALQLVERRLAESPNEQTDLRWRAMLLVALGEKVESERAFRVYQQIAKADPAFLLAFGRTTEVIPLLATACRAKEWTGITPASLRLDPTWDPLRGKPEFEALLAGNAVPETKQ